MLAHFHSWNIASVIALCSTRSEYLSSLSILLHWWNYWCTCIHSFNMRYLDTTLFNAKMLKTVCNEKNPVIDAIKLHDKTTNLMRKHYATSPTFPAKPFLPCHPSASSAPSCFGHLHPSCTCVCLWIRDAGDIHNKGMQFLPCPPYTLPIVGIWLVT